LISCGGVTLARCESCMATTTKTPTSAAQCMATKSPLLAMMKLSSNYNFFKLDNIKHNFLNCEYLKQFTSYDTSITMTLKFKNFNHFY
jgi:hypothetical protein